MSQPSPVDLAAPDAPRQHCLSFDPYHLMPAAIPPHPRVLVTSAGLEHTRRLIQTCAWAKACRDELLETAAKEPGTKFPLPDAADAGAASAALNHATFNALAFHLTDNAEHFDRAVASFRHLAEAFLRWASGGPGVHPFGGGLGEGHANIRFGQAFDLLAAGPLGDKDRELFRAALQAALPIANRGSHRTCGNHNTWCLAGMLGLASALGDRQAIHDVLYGCPCEPMPADSDTPAWRYGLVHQLRHDYMADGLHWERTPGYHMYTLMAITDMLAMFAELGVDLWHAHLPALSESDGHDLHRAWGPPGTRCIKAAYDALFFQAFTNGDLSMVHDSGLANLRGVYIWGTVFELALQAYADPKYAWLLRKAEQDYGTKREMPGQRMSLQTNRRPIEFVRLRHAELPAGQFTLTADTTISQTGQHRHGCTLFPTTGIIVLRSNAAEATGPGAYLFYGPHGAGHQSPAALHLELHAGNTLATDAPLSDGYDDAQHLDWVRTTIAHNTVTIDQRPMFPYDLGGQSIWEADAWRGRVSDGTLETFQPDEGFHAARASNQNVYPGVKLDRTIVVTRRYVLDVYRVFSDHPHTCDWAMHVQGQAAETQATPADLGSGPGYRHLKNVRQLPAAPEARLAWSRPNAVTRAQVLVPPGGQVFLGEDPVGKDHQLGGLEPPGIRGSVIVRTVAPVLAFISLWWFDDQTPAPGITGVQGDAKHAIGVDVAGEAKPVRWVLPIQPGRVRAMEV